MLNRILKGKGNHVADNYVAFIAICMAKSVCGYLLFLLKFDSKVKISSEMLVFGVWSRVHQTCALSPLF